MSARAQSGRRARGRRAARVPLCGKPRSQQYRPFCSKHCADIDLGRWLGGRYAVPGKPVGKKKPRRGRLRRRHRSRLDRTGAIFYKPRPCVGREASAYAGRAAPRSICIKGPGSSVGRAAD